MSWVKRVLTPPPSQKKKIQNLENIEKKYLRGGGGNSICEILNFLSVGITYCIKINLSSMLSSNIQCNPKVCTFHLDDVTSSSDYITS